MRSSIADNRSVRIGQYELGGVLGEGAAGVVYRATRDEVEVAVKVLRAADPIAQKRFSREARLTHGLASQHVVRILEVGDDYIVMPLYRGGSLAQRLRAAGPLGVGETVLVAAQLGKGLDALHERGVLHRDVKPSNVLLDEAGSAALADFGLARAADSTRVTRDGQLLGTTSYLAPELIEGADATRATDIYALGCLLYECLVGAPPFTGDGDAELGFAHLVEPPPDPRTRRPDLSADLALALLSALEKDPRSRPTSATALARMLHLAHTAAPA
jgi:serine/threonine protein kinase